MRAPERICIVSDERFPYSGTDTQQMAKTAAALARQGAQVELLVPRRWRSLLQSEGERRRAFAAYYHVEGPLQLRELLSVPSSLRLVVKPIHQLLATLDATRRRQPLVYTRNLIALVAALACGREVLFDTYRPLPDQKPALGALFRWAAGQRGFLGVTTHSAFARGAFLSAGLRSEQTVAIHNGWDPADLEPRLERDAARARLGLPADGFWALYAGHVRPDKGIGLLLDAVARVPSVRLVLVGATEAQRSWVHQRARGCAAGQVTCHGWVPPDELGVYLQAADVLVVPPTAAPLRRQGNTVLPMKVFNYLAAGRAILAPALPDTAEILRSGHNALLVPPDDPAAAAEALAALQSDPATVAALGAHAALDAQGYTWDARARHLLDFIQRRRAALAADGGSAT